MARRRGKFSDLMKKDNPFMPEDVSTTPARRGITPDFEAIMEAKERRQAAKKVAATPKPWNPQEAMQSRAAMHSEYSRRRRADSGPPSARTLGARKKDLR